MEFDENLLDEIRFESITAEEATSRTFSDAVRRALEAAEPGDDPTASSLGALAEGITEGTAFYIATHLALIERLAEQCVALNERVTALEQRLG